MCVLLSPREQCTHNTCADCDKKLSYFVRRFPSPFELIFPSTDIGHEYLSRPSAKRNPSRMIFARFSCIMCIMDACDLTENPFALKNENSDSTRRVSGQHVSRVETTTKSKIPEEKKKNGEAPRCTCSDDRKTSARSAGGQNIEFACSCSCSYLSVIFCTIFPTRSKIYESPLSCTRRRTVTRLRCSQARDDAYITIVGLSRYDNNE